MRHNDFQIRVSSFTFIYRTTDIPLQQAEEIVNQNGHLKNGDTKEITRTIETLRDLRFSREEIKQQPFILQYPAITIQNRYQSLQECGFSQIELFHLEKYQSLLGKTVFTLKSTGLIPSQLNVAMNIVSFIKGIETKEFPIECDDSEKLRSVRQIIFKWYLGRRLNMSADEIEKMFKRHTNSELTGPSFQNAVKSLDLLENDMNFTKEKISKIPSIMRSAANIKKIVEDVRDVCGMDVREICLKNPSILSNSSENIKQIESCCREFGIPDATVLKNLHVFDVKPEIVRERLMSLPNIRELRLYVNHPCVLRLITNWEKALNRLNLLKSLHIERYSLNVLIDDEHNFRR